MFYCNSYVTSENGKICESFLMTRLLPPSSPSQALPQISVLPTESMVLHQDFQTFRNKYICINVLA